MNEMSARPSHPTYGPIPGYHSQTAYSFPPEDSDAILRATAYHRKDFDLSVIWFPTRTHNDFTTLISPTSRSQATTLGEIDRLPLELIHNILLQLDVTTTFCMRQTNVRARQIVNGLHEFRVITTHATNPLCALLRTQLASNVTLLAFYRLLCTQKCPICANSHGNLVYMPTWIRCCSYCLQEYAPELWTRTATVLEQILQLSKESRRKLPRLRTLPGIYGMDEQPRFALMIVASAQAALSACREETAGPEPPSTIVAGRIKRLNLPYMACCAVPSYNPRTGQTEDGISCAGCQLAIEKGITTHTGEWAADIRDKVYSRKGFLEHFVWCEQAQLLWRDSNRGTTQPPMYPYFCTKGGYFRPRD